MLVGQSKAPRTGQLRKTDLLGRDLFLHFCDFFNQNHVSDHDSKYSLTTGYKTSHKCLSHPGILETMSC